MIYSAKDKKIPFLYHYQKFNEEYIADLLLNDRIKFSNPSNFNDPWDCRLNFSKALLENPEIHSKNVEYAIDLLRRHFHIPETELVIKADELRANKLLMEAKFDEFTVGLNDAIIKDYRVYCLSTEPTNHLMWAHYAKDSDGKDAHKGVCFGFHTDNPIFSEALEVTYTENYPQLNPAEEDECKFLRDVLFTKAKEWESEREYRLIAKENDSEEFFILREGYLPFNSQNLACVIVGCSMPEPDIQKLKSIIIRRKDHVDLFQVHPAKEKYSFETHKI